MPKQPTWPATRRALKSASPEAVLDLLHGLYQLSPDNREFLHARVFPTPGHAAAILAAQDKLLDIVGPNAIYRNHRFSQAEAKRIIDHLEKSTEDPAAVADLLVFDLRESLASFDDVGDYEPLVDHCFASMTRLEKLWPKLTPADRARFLSPLQSLARTYANRFGYGLSDELEDFVTRLRGTRPD